MEKTELSACRHPSFRAAYQPGVRSQLSCRWDSTPFPGGDGAELRTGGSVSSVTATPCGCERDVDSREDGSTQVLSVALFLAGCQFVEHGVKPHPPPPPPPFCGPQKK